MPETYPIPAAQIKGLRITCRKCGVEIMLPVTARESPSKCFNCYTDLDSQAIIAALRELKWLHDTDSRGDSSIGFWLDPKP